MQKKALIVLNFLDDIEKQKNDLQALKRAYLSSGAGDPAKLFPDDFRESVTTKDISEVEDDEAVKFDYSGVTWRSGAEAYAEYETLMSQIGANQHGRMSGDALANRPEWTEWT